MHVLGGYLDVLEIVVGVVLTLTGLGLTLQGLLGIANREVRRGALGALGGIVVAAAGFWLIGILGG